MNFRLTCFENFQHHLVSVLTYVGSVVVTHVLFTLIRTVDSFEDSGLGLPILWLILWIMTSDFVEALLLYLGEKICCKPVQIEVDPEQLIPTEEKMLLV